MTGVETVLVSMNAGKTPQILAVPVIVGMIVNNAVMLVRTIISAPALVHFVLMEYVNRVQRHSPLQAVANVLRDRFVIL